MSLFEKDWGVEFRRENVRLRKDTGANPQGVLSCLNKWGAGGGLDRAFSTQSSF